MNKWKIDEKLIICIELIIYKLFKTVNYFPITIILIYDWVEMLLLFFAP